MRNPWPVLYVLAVVGANVLTEHFGMVLGVTAGTFAVAPALVARNLTQERLGAPRTLALMALGVVLSWWLASPALALASAAAFAISELFDLLVYTRLRDRGMGRAVAVAASLGGIVDTAAFLAIAGFPMAALIPQSIVKATMALAAGASVGVLCSTSLTRRPRPESMTPCEPAASATSTPLPRETDASPASYGPPTMGVSARATRATRRGSSGSR